MNDEYHTDPIIIKTKEIKRVIVSRASKLKNKVIHNLGDRLDTMMNKFKEDSRSIRERLSSSTKAQWESNVQEYIKQVKFIKEGECSQIIERLSLQ